jgi:hypothetical protein
LKKNVMSLARKGTPTWRVPTLGEVLREEFLKPMGLSACETKRLLVPAPRINGIVLENGASQRTPQYASPDSSKRPNSSG